MIIFKTLVGRSSGKKYAKGPIVRNDPWSSRNILLLLADTLHAFVETLELSEGKLPGLAESCGTRAVARVSQRDKMDDACRFLGQRHLCEASHIYYWSWVEVSTSGISLEATDSKSRKCSSRWLGSPNTPTWLQTLVILEVQGVHRAYEDKPRISHRYYPFPAPVP